MFLNIIRELKNEFQELKKSWYKDCEELLNEVDEFKNAW
jgi:hypothetical protein